MSHFCWRTHVQLKFSRTVLEFCELRARGFNFLSGFGPSVTVLLLKSWLQKGPLEILIEMRKNAIELFPSLIGLYCKDKAAKMNACSFLSGGPGMESWNAREF